MVGGGADLLARLQGEPEAVSYTHLDVYKRQALGSLTLSIEHFNRPWDLGRGDAVLILLDHSFEMLLKAAILHRGGRIRDPREKNTIGFDACVRRALSTPAVQFLSEEQALVLQAINGLRDAAQHHLVDLSEAQLYLHAQGGVTLFRDLLDAVFNEKLTDLLPERVSVSYTHLDVYKRQVLGARRTRDVCRSLGFQRSCRDRARLGAAGPGRRPLSRPA